MTVIPRASETAYAKPALSNQKRTKAATGEGMSATKTTATSAVAVRKGMLRGRLAERMAEIAGKASSNAPAKTVGALQPTSEASGQQTAPPQTPVGATASPSESQPERGNSPPQVERAGATLKEHLQPKRLKKDYRALLKRLHERVLDVQREQLFFAPTKDPAPLSGLTINSANRAFGNDYRPICCQLFDWTLAQIDEDLSNFTFIDYGAGKGRALLLAAEHPFSAAAGVEFAEELHDNAQMNIAQYPRSRMRCRNVECVLADAIQVGPPDGASIHFFFNPFSREVFAEVLNNIVMSYRSKPRRLYLILVDPIATDLVDASGVFARTEFSMFEDLKWKALSPYDVAIYRSLA